MKFINIEGYRENCDIFNPISIDSPEEKNYCPQTYFAVNNMFSELITESEKLQARTNLDISWKNLLGEVESAPGLKDFILDQLTWDNINGDATITESLVGDELIIVNQDGENKAVKTSTLIKDAKEVYILDIDNYSTPEDFNNLKNAIDNNKLIKVKHDNGLFDVVYHESETLDNKNYIILFFGATWVNVGSNYAYYPTISGNVYAFFEDGTCVETFQDRPSNISFHISGDGTKFLANDGSYKEVNTQPFFDLGYLEFDSENGTITDEEFINKCWEYISKNDLNLKCLFNFTINNINYKVILHHELYPTVYYAAYFTGVAVADTEPGKTYNIHIKVDLRNEENNTTTYTLTELANTSDVAQAPYIWDGTTSETIFNELVQCVINNRHILYYGQIVQPLFGDDDTQYLFVPKCTDIYIGVVANDTIFKVTKTDVSKEIGGAVIIRDSDRYRTNELQSNTYRDFGVLNNNITFTYYGYNQLVSISEYQGDFSFGDTVYTVTFPTDIKWSTDSVLDYKPNHTYQFRIVNNLGVMKEFANS